MAASERPARVLFRDELGPVCLCIGSEACDEVLSRTGLSLKDLLSARNLVNSKVSGALLSRVDAPLPVRVDTE